MTGSKGLPEAKTAAPFDHLYASSGVHSALEVGFDSAKMIGLSLLADISSMTVWLNDLGSVDTPMRAVGLRAFTADSKSGTCSSRISTRNIGSGASARFQSRYTVHILQMLQGTSFRAHDAVMGVSRGTRAPPPKGSDKQP